MKDSEEKDWGRESRGRSVELHYDIHEPKKIKNTAPNVKSSLRLLFSLKGIKMKGIGATSKS